MSESENVRRVYELIKEAGVYYIASLEGDQPRVRPFGTIHIFEGRLYIQTGRTKDCFQQFVSGKVELCALTGDTWVRLSGKLIHDPREEAEESLLDEYPSLKGMYQAGDGNTAVLYFSEATARICSFSHPEEVLKIG